MKWFVSLKSKINYKTAVISTLIILFSLSIDLITKNIAFNYLHNNGNLDQFDNIKVITITSFFSLVEVYNTGISFGMFSDIGGIKWLLVILTLIIIMFLFVYALATPFNTVRYIVLMIVGAALGNLYDRIALGSVRDFLDFHLFSYHWPAFNMADFIICTAVITLIFGDIFLPKYFSKPNNDTL